MSEQRIEGPGEPAAPEGRVAPPANRRKPRIGDSRPAPSASAAATPQEQPPRGARPSRARKARGGGSRPAPAGDGAPAREADKAPDGAKVPDAAKGTASASASAPEGSGASPAAKRRRRRGGRGRSRSGAGTGAGAAGASGDGAAGAGEEAALSGGEPEEESSRDKGRERKGRPVGRYLMCVHVADGVTQIAVLEGRALIEHYVSREVDDGTQIDGNVYLGKVKNVLPGMEAAFVDIGTPKNAVLYWGDVRYNADDLDEAGSSKKERPRIEQVLRNGQEILCQVIKNPIGLKGARLTQEVSLPGRFVVLAPESDTFGISKRLDDRERRRLRKVIDQIRPAGHGVIVRTAAEGATAAEIKRDIDRLAGQWEAISTARSAARAPAQLHKEPDIAVRVIREEFTRDYRGVVIDDPELYRNVRDYVLSVNPELVDRVELYDAHKESLPLYERYNVHEQLHKALDSKVWLPSGGSLIIERTEALTVIDVNTGKNVGKTNLEETVFRNNLEAAEEVARQLRLRDIGGIIVIDFIDMEIKVNREKVAAAFRAALARDKTRTQVFDISELGLVEMTRKRVSEGLVEAFSTTCPTCRGRGIVFEQEIL